MTWAGLWDDLVGVDRMRRQGIWKASVGQGTLSIHPYNDLHRRSRMATERKTRAVGYAFQHIPASPQSPIPYAHPTADRPLTPGNPPRYLSRQETETSPLPTSAAYQKTTAMPSPCSKPARPRNSPPPALKVSTTPPRGAAQTAAGASRAPDVVAASRETPSDGQAASAPPAAAPAPPRSRSAEQLPHTP